jgi:hypothetical protein
MTDEPWLDRKKLAGHYSCSVRSIELALAEGMPHAVVFGRVKFQVSTVEPWLVERGYIERRIYGGCTVVTGSDENGAATALTAPLHDREVESR